jgi:hypothetical protein
MENNPLGGTDPDGHCCWDEFVGVAGAAGQVVSDTVVGGAKGVWNQVAGVATTINRPIDAALSAAGVDFQFGAVPSATGSTPGQTGAIAGVEVVSYAIPAIDAAKGAQLLSDASKAGDAISMTQAVEKGAAHVGGGVMQYDNMVANAPADYPEVFLVTQAERISMPYYCTAILESQDQVVQIAASGFAKRCKALIPGTLYYGNVRHVLGGHAIKLLTSLPNHADNYVVMNNEPPSPLTAFLFNTLTDKINAAGQRAIQGASVRERSKPDHKKDKVDWAKR